MGRLKTGLDWFRLDSGFADHPKVLRLAESLKAPEDLKVPLAATRGHLATLWCWVARYFPTGLLKGVTPAEVAQAAGYRGDKAFADVLLEHGFLDETRGGTLRVHGWAERHGPDLRRRQAERDRKRAVRAQNRERAGASEDSPPGQDADTQRTKNGVRAASAPTGPDRTGTGPHLTSRPVTGPGLDPQNGRQGAGKHRRLRAQVAGIFDGGFPATPDGRTTAIDQLLPLVGDGGDEHRRRLELRALLQTALTKDNAAAWATDVACNGRWPVADGALEAAKAELQDRGRGDGGSKQVGETLKGSGGGEA